MAGERLLNDACSPCGGNGNTINIVQGYQKSYVIDLFYTDTTAPYDLTGATEIAAIHPGTSGTPVIELLTAGKVIILGSPGAGRVQVNIIAANSALLQLNPNGDQPQDLQVSVTNADTTKTVFIIPAVLDITAPDYGVV